MARDRLLREAVRELRASGAAIVHDDGTIMAHSGRWDATATPVMTIPLPGTATSLAIGPSARGRSYSPDALQALRGVATLAARTIVLSSERVRASEDAPSPGIATAAVSSP